MTAAEAAAQEVKEKEEALESATDMDQARQELLEAVAEEQRKISEAQSLVRALPADLPSGVDDKYSKQNLQNRLDEIIASYAERYVKQAEEAITQPAIDKAMEYVNKLPVDKQAPYQKRLDTVQQTVSAIDSAREAVRKAENEQTQENIDAARIKVEALNRRGNQEKLVAEFTKRLDEVEKEIERSALAALIEQASNTFVKVSEDGTNVLISDQWVDEKVHNTLKNAISSAESVYNEPTSVVEDIKEAKTNLTSEISLYNNAKKYGTKDVLSAATKAVGAAEVQAEKEAKNEDDPASESAQELYDIANALVDELDSNGADKSDLVDRLETVDTIIQATAAVVKAEGRATLTNMTAAKELVGKLAAGDIKDALTERIDQLTTDDGKTTGDLNQAIKDAKIHIGKQEHDEENPFYQIDSYEKFEESYEAAVKVQEKGGSATTDEVTLATEGLLDAMSNLIEAAKPVYKEDQESPAGKQTVKLNLQPKKEELADRQVTSGGVLGLDIGIVDLGLLSASQISGLADNTKHEVIVEKGTTYDAELTVAIHTVLGGQAFDVGVYKKETDGNYKQIDVLSGSSGGALGIASTAKFTLDTLEEGEYVFILDLGAGLAVVQVAPFKLINQVVNDYSKSTENVKATGEILADWNLGGKEQGIVSHVKVHDTIGDPEELEEEGKTSIQGRYGKLFIDRTGKYEYIPENSPTNIGKIETFEYTVTNTHNGEMATGDLQIRIGADTVEWDEENWSQEVTVVEAKSEEKTTAIDVNNAIHTVTPPNARSGLGIWYNRTLESEAFKVQDITSVLTFDIRKNLPATKEANVKVINTNTGKVVWEKKMGISNETQSLEVRDLEAGTYKITAKGTGSMGGSTGRLENIKVSSSAWGNYVVTDPRSLTGNIRQISGNKLGEDDNLKTTLAVKGYLMEDGHVASVQTFHRLDDKGSKVIAGKYGVLTVERDGAYTYKPNAQVKVAGQTDVFTYKLTHASGIESESTLTFKIDPLTASTSTDDVLAGTPGVDTFTGQGGSDTLVYTVLKEDATGGNNHDKWTDFHFGTIANDPNADRVDLRLLFDGRPMSDIGEYIELKKSGNSLTIKVDRDGAGGTYQPTDILTLTSDNLPEGKISIQDLINNGQLIVQ